MTVWAAITLLTACGGRDETAALAAEQRATDRQVEAVATDMISEHRSLQEPVDSVALALNVTPQSPPMADSMQARVHAVRDSVGAVANAEFDRTYMQPQVRAHEQALEALRQPATTAGAALLRATIDRAIQIGETHLARA